MSRKRNRGLPPSLPEIDPDAASDEGVPRTPGKFRVPRSSVSPPNYLSRPVQRRLLTLVGMFGLVLVLMQQARQPARWHWLWQMTGQGPLTASPHPPTPPVPRTAVTETAVQDKSVTEMESSDGANSDPVSAGTRIDQSAQIPAGRPRREDPRSVGEVWSEGLDPSLLKEVRDNSHFRRSEQTAWFTLWSRLRDTSAEELNRQSLGPVTYLQLLRQTDAYRGRLVDLTGTIRRIHRVTAPPNDLGIAGYAQCWLFSDARPADPIVLYVLESSDDLPDADQIALPVRATGVVYKRWSYLGTEQMEVAPVVLAKNVTRVTPSPVKQPRSLSDRPRFLPLVLSAAVGAGLTVAVLLRLSGPRSNLPSRQRPVALPTGVDPGDAAMELPSSPVDK